MNSSGCAFFGNVRFLEKDVPQYNYYGEITIFLTGIKAICGSYGSIQDIHHRNFADCFFPL